MGLIFSETKSAYKVRATFKDGQGTMNVDLQTVSSTDRNEAWFKVNLITETTQTAKSGEPAWVSLLQEKKLSSNLPTSHT